jgi:hypothetical protein
MPRDVADKAWLECSTGDQGCGERLPGPFAPAMARQRLSSEWHQRSAQEVFFELHGGFVQFFFACSQMKKTYS